MNISQSEQLNELMLELEQSRQREKQLARENHTILRALSSITTSENHHQIFKEIKRVLSLYIDFDDFVVLTRTDSSQLFQTLLTTNQVFNDYVWQRENKFSRAVAGECIILFQPNVLVEFSGFNSLIKDELQSALLIGVKGQVSESIILLLGRRKGQFDIQTRERLKRFKPLIERAIIDIENKEQLQKLVQHRTCELEKAQQKAIEANNAKSQFLAMMSHEIRTPLNAILGLIDVLTSDTEKTTHLTMLGQMEASAELLLVIINDILDLTKIETGHFDLNLQWVSIVDEFDNGLSHLRQLAEKKGLVFNCHCNIDEESEYWMDPTRFSQVIFNLVGNAVKFTHSGNITVVLQEADGRLTLAVQDTGIGISEEVKDSLFSPFKQADGSITRNYGGTGLGLTITKHLARIMGGDIGIQSELGVGSTFEVEIPIKKRLKVDSVNSAGRSLKVGEGLHVLVVEDTKTNQMVIELVLKNHGLDVSILNNGKEACDFFKGNSNSCNIDLILMDLSMPEMDGLTASRALRNMGVNLPIIALTAHVMEQDKQECIKAGMNGFVAKPIRSEDIIATINDVLERA